MQSGTRASSEASGQAAAMKPRNQQAGMSAGGNTEVQKQTMGARTAVNGCAAVVPVDASGNVT